LPTFLLANPDDCKSGAADGPGGVAKMRRRLSMLGAMESQAGGTVNLAARSTRLCVRRANGYATIGTDRLGAAATRCAKRVFEALNFDDSAVAHRLLPVTGPELYHSGFQK